MQDKKAKKKGSFSNCDDDVNVIPGTMMIIIMIIIIIMPMYER